MIARPLHPTASRAARRASVLLAGAAVLAIGLGPVAYAADGADGAGEVKVVNTETVQVYLDSDAKVTSQRVYEQLALTGKGKVDLTNPVSTKGLRNLGGFGGIKVDGGDQVVRTTVDGEKKYRAVSSNTHQLPLDVRVRYTLDGKRVEPGDVVGKSGKLAVQFTVTNVTGKDEKVTYRDASGKNVTTTEEVVVPIVGSLTTTAPASFTNVTSKQANIAGDGKGATRLSFTMTLFPPIGAPSTSFGYTANIKDGVVPRVDISALPVNPLESPTFKSAAESYQGGADTGIQLTDGAVQIDTNLLKLRDGSAELLKGLIKLRDGADKLSDGLNDDAAPGAKKLDDGAQQLKTGATKLNDGTGKALAGGEKLAGGLSQISNGLAQLDGKFNSPDSQSKLAALRAGVQLIIDGVGDPGAGPNSTTLIGALKALNSTNPAAPGLPLAKAGATQLKGGLETLRGDGNPSSTGAGLSGLRNGLSPASDSLADKVKPGGSADQLIGGLTALENNAACAADPTCKGTATALKNGAIQSKTDLTALSQGLARAVIGLGNAVDALNGLLIPGAGQLETGLTSASAGTAALEAKVSAGLRPGLLQLQAGINSLLGSLGQASSGIGQLNSGAAQAYAGNLSLNDGLGQLDEGSGKLAAGTGTLKAGTGKLSTGLVTAADGSDQIAEGLKKAAKKAPALPKGAKALSDKGTKKLISAGESTTKTYAQNVAIIQASAERANTSSMAYGAPKGAVGLTAYSYIIKGDDGESGRNVARTLGGVAVLAAGAGVLLARRRFAA